MIYMKNKFVTQKGMSKIMCGENQTLSFYINRSIIALNLY